MTVEPVTTVAATMPGQGPANQDHLVVTPHAVAVLDGATDWLRQDPDRDGGWYARHLGAELTVGLEDRARDLAQIVAQAIERLCQRFGLTPGESPSSTVTIARWDDETLDVYVLGDSPAVVFGAAGETSMIADERLASVAVAARDRYRDHLLTGRGYDDHFPSLMTTLQLEERAQRNRENGYWIAASDPQAAHRALERRFVRAEVDAVLIATDGAGVDVLSYGRHTWRQFADHFSESPEGFLRGIRRAELEDHDGMRWPRAKRSDDKTVVLIAFS